MILLAIVLLLGVFGVLIWAGYALMHDYPIWQIALAIVGAAVLMALAGAFLMS